MTETREDHQDLERYLGNAIVSTMLAAAVSRKLRLPGINSGAARAKEILDQMLDIARRLTDE
jgi:hypothetical protein